MRLRHGILRQARNRIYCKQHLSELPVGLSRTRYKRRCASGTFLGWSIICHAWICLTYFLHIQGRGCVGLAKLIWSGNVCPLLLGRVSHNQPFLIPTSHWRPLTSSLFAQCRMGSQVTKAIGNSLTNTQCAVDRDQRKKNREAASY